MLAFLVACALAFMASLAAARPSSRTLDSKKGPTSYTAHDSSSTQSMIRASRGHPFHATAVSGALWSFIRRFAGSLTLNASVWAYVRWALRVISLRTTPTRLVMHLWGNYSPPLGDEDRQIADGLTRLLV
ncbi:hypothetical protein B0H13DRAFT_2317852 [Mycena leptocephala]|nr:hypothetical protein B0H13DRAFT_2317852 [Mycena leptocephala]